jgi:feruloyl esterase
MIWSGALLGLAACVGGVKAAFRECTSGSFASLLPSGVQIESVGAVSNGSSYGEGRKNIAYPQTPTALPELCALIVNVTSSPQSFYRFGLFLPSNWNSRFLAVGNSGFAGGINWLDMGAGVRYGFATISTDTGHNSTLGDVSWALNNEDRRKDFGFRAIHGSVILARQLVEHYYGENISYSYYSGCSTGGRQGLKEAQMYPDTFDGLLVGAPAWWTSHLQTWTTKLGALNLPIGDPKRITPDLFPVIGAEVIKQCDEVDGYKDGIVSAPDLCDFKVDVLLCGTNGVNTSGCLTSPQIETVKKIYTDYYADTKFAFPGLSPGSEGLWNVLLGGSTPSSLGTQYEQYFLFDDPSWKYQAYNDSIVWMADDADPGDCTADDYDMRPFAAAGGKIVMYHGMADGLISTASSSYFYTQVAISTTGGHFIHQGGISVLQEWFRLFLVPGMGHCAGTQVDAPWYFAGANQAGSLRTGVRSAPGLLDTEHDALLALMDWVEKDTAPDRIVATTWKDPSDPSSGVLRQRPLCPHPQTAQYDGNGDEKMPESWICKQIFV